MISEVPGLGGFELIERFFDLSFDLAVVVTLLVDFIHQRFLFAVHVVQQSGFEGADFLDFHTFQVTFVRGVQHNTHFSNVKRCILSLLH